MLLIANGALPVFVSVVDCDALVVPMRTEPNARLVGENETAGAVPVPLRPTVCGLPEALSVIDTLALRLPLAVGENVAEIVQLDPAASVDGPRGHVLVCAKSPVFVPDTAMFVIVSAAVPELVSVVD